MQIGNAPGYDGTEAELWQDFGSKKDQRRVASLYLGNLVCDTAY